MSIIDHSEYDGKIVCYKAFSKNGTVLQSSSSGGIFYELANYVLDRGGLVAGACFDKDFVLKTGIVDNKFDLKALMGSKYVQSHAGQAYQLIKKQLQNNKTVLFCGTPCQCKALRKYIGEIKLGRIIIVDFICHGVPSENLFKSYLNHISDGLDVENVSFRDKKISWGEYGVSIKLKDGTEYFNEHKKDSYMKIFLSNMYLRPSCYKCRAKGGNRSSDITLGDYWSGAADNKNGCSVIFLNTDKGKEYFCNIADNVFAEQISLADALKSNPSYYQSCGKPFRRVKVIKEIRADSARVFNETDSFLRISLYEKVIRRSLRIIKEMLRSFVSADEKKYIDGDISGLKKSFSERADCCGCEACYSVCPTHAIKMTADEEGFFYPVVDREKCCNCGKCNRMCGF